MDGRFSGFLEPFLGPARGRPRGRIRGTQHGRGGHLKRAPFNASSVRFWPELGPKMKKTCVFHENGRKPGRSQALFGEKNLFPEMAQKCPGCCFHGFPQTKRTRARTQSLDNARGVQATRDFTKVHWQCFFFDGVSRHCHSSGRVSCLRRCRVSARHRVLFC